MRRTRRKTPSPLRVVSTLATKNASECLANYLEPSPAVRRVWRQFFRRGKRFWGLPVSLRVPLLFALGNEVQNGLKIEKSGSFGLAGFSYRHTAEVAISRALI
jgi:hypothetical protein